MKEVLFRDEIIRHIMEEILGYYAIRIALGRRISIKLELIIMSEDIKTTES